MSFKMLKSLAREQRGNAGTFPRAFSLPILKSHPCMYVLPAQGMCAVLGRKGESATPRGNVPARSRVSTAQRARTTTLSVTPSEARK